MKNWMITDEKYFQLSTPNNFLPSYNDYIFGLLEKEEWGLERNDSFVKCAINYMSVFCTMKIPREKIIFLKVNFGSIYSRLYNLLFFLLQLLWLLIINFVFVISLRLLTTALWI